MDFSIPLEVQPLFSISACDFSQLADLEVEAVRIIGQFRLEGTSGALSSNPLLKAGSAMISDLVTRGFIHPGLQCVQG